MVTVNEDMPVLVVFSSVCTLFVLVASTLWTCWKIRRAMQTEAPKTYTMYTEETTDELKENINEEEEGALSWMAEDSLKKQETEENDDDDDDDGDGDDDDDGDDGDNGDDGGRS